MSVLRFRFRLSEVSNRTGIQKYLSNSQGDKEMDRCRKIYVFMEGSQLAWELFILLLFQPRVSAFRLPLSTVCVIGQKGLDKTRNGHQKGTCRPEHTHTQTEETLLDLSSIPDFEPNPRAIVNQTNLLTSANRGKHMKNRTFKTKSCQLQWLR